MLINKAFKTEIHINNSLRRVINQFIGNRRFIYNNLLAIVDNSSVQKINYIDKDGNISSWAIGHKDSKVKSFLQNMSEKAEEILQKQLEKANLNYQNHLLVVAQDIDETVALMCYIQLSLLGVAGYVKVGNSLTEPMTDNDNKENYWFTPMYYSNVWVLRRIFGGR